jgi:hypothetical protein
MSQNIEDSDLPEDVLNVKKPKRRRRIYGTYRDPWEPVRRTMLATGEFYRGLAEATAESFRAFNDELHPDNVEETGLTCSFIEGLAQGNAEFYETLSKSSERVFDQLRPEEEEVRTVPVEIDYDRLAKLIAAELRKDKAAKKGLD